MGKLIWVTGYFGAGKSTLTQAAVEAIPNLEFLKVFTTRQQRPGEEGSKKGELEFVNKEEYEEMRSSSAVWDHSEVAGNFYGSDVESVNAQLNKGQNLLLPVVPESKILDEMKPLYAVTPILIWIDTPLAVTNTRLQTLRPDRISHYLQTEETRENMINVSDYVFTPVGELDRDIPAFVELITTITG